MRGKTEKRGFPVVLAGAAIGALAVLLSALGNPANMGLSVACFLRDTAGALGLHAAQSVQYVRPELTGVVLGSMLAAALRREFRPRGGSSPVTRFVVALVVMVGAMVFLGCPLRMLLRIGGGDLNAVVGLGGFAAGVFVGTLWLKSGFTLRRAYPQGLAEGAAFPAAAAVLLLLFVNVPALFRQSASGAGSLHAPVLVSLGAGLLAGALSQRSRFCVMSSVRNVFLFRDGSMLLGVAALVAAVFAGNLLLGNFRLSFSGQPAAQTDALWNFLSMALVGWGSVLLNGCPLRQLVLAGEGESDAAVAVLGFLTGAALCHNFGLVSFANGPTANGMVAVIIGYIVLLVVGLTNRERA